MVKPQDQYSSIYYSTLLASLGGLIVGYTLVTISVVVLFLADYYQLKLEEQEMIIGLALLFAALGSLVAGVLCSSFGRKKTIIIAATLFLFSSLFSLYEVSFQMLKVNRAILGFAVGLAFTSVPFYISEIVPANIRGSCLCVFILEFYLGYFFSYLVSRSVVFAFGWRVALSSACIPALGLLIGITRMPESPIWLYGKQKKEEAINALKKLRRRSDIEYEIGELEESSEFNKDLEKKLTSAVIIKTIFIGIGLSVLIELSGAHAIFYYIPSFLSIKGMWIKRAALDATLWVGLSSFLSAFLAMLMVDHLGRRRLLMIGVSIMVASLLLMGYLFRDIGFIAQYHQWTIFFLSLFAAGFTFGLGTVGFLIIVEIYPLKWRSLLISTIFAIKWVCSYLVSRYFLGQLVLLGLSNTFWIYCAICVLGIFFIYYFVPETKGKSLNVIEEDWIEDKNAERLF